MQDPERGCLGVRTRTARSSRMATGAVFLNEHLASGNLMIVLRVSVERGKDEGAKQESFHVFHAIVKFWPVYHDQAS